MAQDYIEAVPYDHGWAWATVLGCGFMNVFIVGTFKSFGIIFVEICEMFQASAAAAMVVAAVLGIINCLLAPFATAVGKKLTYRTVVMFGGFVIGCGCLISSFAQNVTHVIVTYGICTGIGQACCYGPSFVALGSYFRKHRTFANGLAVAGSSVGTFILPPLIRYLVDEYSFRGAMMILGGLLFNLCVCGALYRPLSFYKQRQTTGNYEASRDFKEKLQESIKDGEQILDPVGDERRQSMESLYLWKSKYTSNGSLQFIPTELPKKRDPIIISGSAKPTHNESAIPLKDSEENTDDIVKNKTDIVKNKTLFREILDNFDFSLFRQPLFCIFMCIAFFGNAGYVNSTIILPPFAKELQIDKKSASWLLSVLGICDLFGRVSCGFIFNINAVTKVIKRHWSFMVFLIFLGLGTLILPLIRTHNALVAWSVFHGIFGGAYFSLFPTVLTEFVGVNRISGAFGWTSMVFGFSVTIGPPIMGYIKDCSGTYIPAFIICGVFLLIGGSMVLLKSFVKKFTPKEKISDV